MFYFLYAWQLTVKVMRSFTHTQHDCAETNIVT